MRAETIQNISTEEELVDVLAEPYPEDIEFARTELEGDVMVLGAGGKLGPTLVRRILRATERADADSTVYAVSRFSDPNVESRLQAWGAETITADLLDEGALNSLPDCENIIYLIGMKFGANDQRPKTWAVNTYLPGQIARRFENSRIVALSTSNIYPFVPTDSNGAKETEDPSPVGEYAQSCLGRERVFQFFARERNIPICLLRLNYAIELRYGVLVDIGKRVYEGKPVPLDMSHLKAIWQGDANSMCFRSLGVADVPAEVLNITGTDTHSVQRLAERFGKEFGHEVTFEGEAHETALFNDASKSHEIFGEPKVSVDDVVPAVASWLESGGETLGKPTKFHIRNGEF